jgi:hypothetical protein
MKRILQSHHFSMHQREGMVDTLKMKPPNILGEKKLILILSSHRSCVAVKSFLDSSIFISIASLTGLSMFDTFDS